MSWWFSAAYDPFMRRTERACLEAWRRDLLAPLSTWETRDVLEIGAGTGANVPFYPSALERLVLTDEDEHMLQRLRRRPDTSRAEIVRASASALPFSDATFDVVVSTLVLCSVPDVPRALGEIRRVLRPAGRLVFLEHVAADATEGIEARSRLRWQERLEPLWCRLAGNCHLTRDTGRYIVDAGFSIASLTRESMRKALPLVRPTVRGIARRPP